MRGRPVASVTARAMVSLASEPEWPSQTRLSLPPGVIESSFSASRTAGALTADRMPAAAMFASAVSTASRTAGWPCPRLAAPQVAERSRTLRPSASIRWEPSPPFTASGKKRRFCIRDSA